MALVAEFLCLACRHTKLEEVTPSRLCLSCRTAKSEAEEALHMQALAALPIEERVRRIELALYRLNADSRLKVLECVRASR